MDIWILTVRGHRYHPNRRLLEAAGLLEQRAFLIHPGKLYLGVSGREWILDGRVPLRRPDVVLPRLGATIKEYGLTAIRQLQLMGIPVMNRFEAILLASNKFLSLQTLVASGIPVPETRYASNRSNFADALASLGGFPIVIKISNSRQGSGVFLFHSMEKAMPTLALRLEKGHGVLMQRFIPAEERKDLRILVGGGEVLGAMSLTPRKGEFRSNIHLGGKPEAVSVSDETASLALRSAEALGLDVAGVDMVEDRHGSLRVMEVNSTPGFKGLEKCTGKDIAAAIIRCSIMGKGSGV
jgi:ribosomal protein S6--L-glutamate ligase